MIRQKKYSKNLSRKIVESLFWLCVYRFGNTLLLPNIDQQQLIASAPINSIAEFVKMYSGESNTITLFSLGIMPYINASIIIDTLTTSIPSLEKLQSEEGLQGKNKIYFYKKVLTIFFAIVQSYFLLTSMRGFLYDTSFLAFTLTLLLLVTGSLLGVWICNILDALGLVNSGASLIILMNIIISLFGKLDIRMAFFSFQPSSILTILFIIYLIFLINFSQMASYKMPIISAKQLDYLEKQRFDFERKTHFLQKPTRITNDISIKLNQAGIFPLIVASNVVAFLSSSSFGSSGILSFFFSNKFFQNILYYSLIVASNFFYTSVFWDAEKVSEQLRKSSVSIVNKTPGKETTNYLLKVVRSTAIRGGILLCSILLGYDIIKNFTNSSVLAQLNISSLIVTIGIVNEISKNLQYFGILNLYKKKSE